jgi:hypothetical protein
VTDPLSYFGEGFNHYGQDAITVASLVYTSAGGQEAYDAMVQFDVDDAFVEGCYPPYLVQPTGQITSGAGNPLFGWTPPEDVTRYQLYVQNPAGNRHFNEILTPAQLGCEDTYNNGCEIDIASLDPADVLVSNGDYQWWIRAEVSGTWQEWVGPETFTLTIPAPGLVTEESITGGDTLTPTWAWSTDDNANYFRVYLAGDDGSVPVNRWFTRAELCGGYAGTSCTFNPTPAAPLVDGVTYTLYVQSYGPGGYSSGGFEDSGYVAFTPLTVTLPRPTGDAPSGEILFSNGDLTYTWTGLVGATRYEIYIARAGVGVVFYQPVDLSDVTCDEFLACSFTPTDVAPSALLVANGDYVWWLRAEIDGAFWTPWDGPNTFTLNVAEPDLVTPGTTTGTDTLRPTWNWTTDDNANWFRLYLGGDDGTVPVNGWVNRADLCGDFSSTDCAFTPDFDLTNGVTYTFYVRSYGPGGYSIGGVNDSGYRDFAPVTITLSIITGE